MKTVEQQTIAAPIDISGIGIHSGARAQIQLRPAPPDTGILFRRLDVSSDNYIAASADCVEESLLCSTLVKGDVRIATVEHLMSACAAWAIDNVYVDVSGPELPILDGSSIGFWFLMRDAGVISQGVPRVYWRILSSVQVQSGDRWARFEPAVDTQAFDIEVSFPHPVLAPYTRICFDLFADDYAFDVARARTFGFNRDLTRLRDQGLALGGSLSNAVLLDDDRVVNPEGLRYPDECLRHKLLDAIGDVYLLGHPFIGRFSAYKPGHALNTALVRALLAQADRCVRPCTISSPSSAVLDHQKQTTSGGWSPALPTRCA